MAVNVKTYAKLNFTLDITGVRNGFHTLDSLVCTVDLYDLIKLTKRKDGRVSIEMHGMGTETLSYEMNNAAKAAERYIEHFVTCGADIKIYKNIPVGGGLGGSSADAAGVLRGMAMLYGKGSAAELKALADGLGSDTGYMLEGGWARLNGRGEQVKKLYLSAILYILLLLPATAVSTAECYKTYDLSPELRADTDGAIAALSAGDIYSLGKSLGNALYPAAIELNEEVSAAYEELSGFAPCGVNMTGSGSAVFAVFETRELRDWAMSRYRGKFRCIPLKTYIPRG